MGISVVWVCLAGRKQGRARVLGFGSSVCGRREQLQGAQPRGPRAGLAARRLRCSGGKDV